MRTIFTGLSLLALLLNFAWANSANETVQQKTENAHLASDTQPISKNTGDPNTSFLLSVYANNLPVFNHFKEDSGCYIACYSNKPGVYNVDQYGVHGLIRVSGTYPVKTFNNSEENRICQPQVASPISESQELKNLCNSHLNSCANECWAGGDTGGFFLRMGLPDNS